MQAQPTVTVLGLPNASEIELDVRKHLERLERFYGRITSCRVAVSSPHRHKNQGRLFEVRVELAAPVGDVVVSREVGPEPGHEDVHLAIRDAFKAARRRLQDHVRRLRDFTDVPAERPEAAVGPHVRATERARRAAHARDVEVRAGPVHLPGSLTIPADALAVVIFAHGSGSGRRSERNRYVSDLLHSVHVGTLLFDLLTEEEMKKRQNVFDIPLLAQRLAAATRWAESEPGVGGLPVGYFGASTGAAAALTAAASDPAIGAVVCRGGRPGLADRALPFVLAPTLLVVGADDGVVLTENRKAFEQLLCPKDLVVVPGASHLFEEPGALEAVARAARDWFVRHLIPARAVS